MEQCLIIVGRSRSAKKFAETLVESLEEHLEEEQFEVEMVDSLGDLSQLDGMSRFIAFVLIHEDSKKEMRLEKVFSSLINLQMGVRLFENINDANSYAEEHYSYNKEQETVFEDDELIEEESEDYPDFTAEEIEDFLMFESLFRTGKLATIRGKVYEKPVTVMAQIINGPDQIRVTPYAIMVSQEILENMELPKIDERD